MRHDAQLDLAVVGAGDHAPRRRHEGFAHPPPFRRADGDVLQVGVVAGQAPRHRHRLGIVGVHPARARVGQLGQLVGVGALQFGQAAVLQQLGGQRVVFRQLLQHLFVGAAGAGGGLLHHGHAELVEEDFAQLFGAAQVEGLAGDLVGLGFQLQDALAQLVALRCQRRCVDQHAITLNAVQRLAGRHFQRVDAPQRVVGLQLGPQHAVYVQRLVRVFTRVVCCLADLDLAERNLVRALATQVFVVHAATAQMAVGQAGQAVGFVHFQHVALQHGVVRKTLHFDTVVGEHMAVVLDVLPELLLLAVHQPGGEARQHLVARQLGWRIRVIVRQRNVGSCARLHAEADAHDLGHHLVQRGGFRVQRHQVCSVDAGQPGVEGLPGQHGVVGQG